MTARRAALEALRRTEKGAYSTIALDNTLAKSKLDERDRSLASALFYGVQENQTQLDAAIAALLRKPGQKLETDVRLILRMGIYQLGYMDKIPDSAAVNEAVSLARQPGHDSAAGFVNGILRGYIRAGKQTPLPDRASDPLLWLSLKYSCPMWLAQLWTESYGEELCESIMQTFSGRPPIFARVNRTKCSREGLIQRLAEEGVTARPVALLPDAVELEHTGDVEQLRTYKKGFFHVQDISSQLCAGIVGAQKGETILDACAAPGGKSFCAAMLMRNEGKIYSFDLHKNKLSLIKSGAEKLGINIIEIMQFDSRNANENLIGSADRVICDVPCSGIGVIAKKPDIRYKKLSDFSRLHDTQSEILNSSVKYLKTGGRICYSTCTIRKAENEEITGEFLSKNKNFKMIEEKTFIPDGTRDGFYYAVMEKVSD